MVVELMVQSHLTKGSVFGARNDTNPGTDVTSNAVVVKTTRDITDNVEIMWFEGIVPELELQQTTN
ncbi:MAG: hypothetical protein LBU18_00510 [Treponema sp.]|jgi:hypothetical protein|nr:hypothetical protein [Treponema sp.]